MPVAESDISTEIVNVPGRPLWQVQVRWREVDSSNVEAIGWDVANNMYVRFKSGLVYAYIGVSRQKAVACAHAKSSGRYLNKRIKGHYPAVRIPK